VGGQLTYYAANYPSSILMQLARAARAGLPADPGQLKVSVAQVFSSTRRTAITLNYQFGDVDADGALIRAQAAALEAEHQAIIRDVLAAGEFWGGAGSTACQQFITGPQLSGDLRTGQRPRLQGANRQQQHGQYRQRRWLELGLMVGTEYLRLGTGWWASRVEEGESSRSRA
jgi:hypothetical protein